MGQSTDALLLYGISLKEDSLDEYDEEDENAPEEGPAWMAYQGEPVDGIEMVRHQSCDVPRYFVAIEKTLITAWRGHPMPVSHLLVGKDWDERLKAFIKKYKLKTDSKPGWWLASDWC